MKPGTMLPSEVDLGEEFGVGCRASEFVAQGVS